ncbi:DUF1499 domain-containing protein [Jannaschia ovalis]|uniref:DUF1499 domain-containing protein n=1 Tax=Jannaschia ovalis TaxID=3038773 RepID=A0ABY8L9P3_9RHOB|nr:DUF1499 domain-containing protein [Jannaschia sp. GRR-S6-38]WGH78084.1 DUF1499 domain-containing protein [Jannaschia sp. GRR-S6-38]
MIKRTFLALALGLPVAAAIGVRAAPMPAARWHIDPASGASTGNPNEFRVAPGGDMEPVRLDRAPLVVATELDAIALGEPGTEAIAGSLDEGFVTYVQRSRLIGWPDAISVKVEPDGDGARLLIWSRSRFGVSDMGVNRARVERWLDKLGASAG